MNTNYIRNFSIIAHIDHGKSTLADRMLELTGTVEKRKMKEQLLDRMELERERGITIKMKPVRMNYTLHSTLYTLNLIDTPGHIDFYYEVSRSLKAVEGAILLVDATQGVQAQTLTTLKMAQDAGLAIIPVVNKIDLPSAQVGETKHEIMTLLGCNESEILEASGKTGEGVERLLQEIVEKIPAPIQPPTSNLQSLIFDFEYSPHRGVIVFTRLFGGKIKKGDQLKFVGAKEKFTVSEVGFFLPDEKASDTLHSGEIGYIVTGIKRPGVAGVGDTVTSFAHSAPALEGYLKPAPVVWASVYPENQDDFPSLSQSLSRIQLSDSSLSFEEEASGALGRGFRCGFLGSLHMEIITERLRREFNLNLVVTAPTVGYKFEGDAVYEPWVLSKIITPPDYVAAIMKLLPDYQASVTETDSFGTARVAMRVSMPLRELMRGFFDVLKSVTAGHGSLSYEIAEMRPGDVEKLEILVGGEVVPAFTKYVWGRRLQEEAETTVEKLYKIFPKQLVVVKIQAQAKGRIIASRQISAMKKDVTGYLYGGDITRKMKLREKQKKGKKKMQSHARITIPPSIFLKMLKNS